MSACPGAGHCTPTSVPVTERAVPYILAGPGAGHGTPAPAPVTDHAVPYPQVQERDTLTSIAARFDCLPTEVMKANRLGARLVFPGQVLLVPSRLPDQPAAAESDGAGESLRGAGEGRGGAGARVDRRDWLGLMCPVFCL